MEKIQGWQCPVCKVVYAPHIEKCTCATQESKMKERLINHSENLHWDDQVVKKNFS